MKMLIRGMIVLLLALGLVSCAEDLPETENIIVIVIDTLRADHLPFYGYENDTAPFLTSLAEQSTIFDDASSTSSWTSPATASLFTSLHPVQHGVLTGVLAFQRMFRFDRTIGLNRIPKEIVTLPEMMKNAGYRTFGISDNMNISSLEGFESGFDSYNTFNYDGAEHVNRQLMEWKDEITSGGRYFLYLHYMDPHIPYHPREPWYEAGGSPEADAIAAYDSEIRYLDDRIRELFEQFGWAENALVIVTSDHGEEFWDHGGTTHGRTLYSEVLRIPLFIYLPGVSPRRVSEPVSILDIMPTLREYVGIPAEQAEEGLSLIPALRGKSPGFDERHVFAHLRRQIAKGGNTRKAVTHRGWKYIITLPDREELFDLSSDPRETRNLIVEERETADSLRTTLDTMEATWPRFTPENVKTSLDEETLEKLKSMGYVGDAPPKNLAAPEAGPR